MMTYIALTLSLITSIAGVEKDSFISIHEAANLGVEIESIIYKHDNLAHCSELFLVARRNPTKRELKKYHFKAAKLLFIQDEITVFQTPIGGWWGHGKLHSNMCINKNIPYDIYLELNYISKKTDEEKSFIISILNPYSEKNKWIVTNTLAMS